MILQIGSILLWTVVVPFLMGLLFNDLSSDKITKLFSTWIYGLVSFFALFQIVTVTNMLTINNFPIVCQWVIGLSIGCAVLGLLVEVFRLKKAGYHRTKNIVKPKGDLPTIMLWILFTCTILFQLIQAIRLAYADGDDAYYVATSTYGATVEKMYSQIPYTGYPSEFDTRHCLAPFPLWISFLTRMSALGSSEVAHVIVPLLLIPITYIIYALIGKKVVKNSQELAMFMIFISIIQIFGNYSLYSSETFLLTRTRQGKAALACLVIPLAIYLFIVLMEKKKNNEKVSPTLYWLLFLNGIFASLCSTMGNLIYPLLIFVMSIVIFLMKRKMKEMLLLLGCCIPSIVMLLLYLKISM